MSVAQLELPADEAPAPPAPPPAVETEQGRVFTDRVPPEFAAPGEYTDPWEYLEADRRTAPIPEPEAAPAAPPPVAPGSYLPARAPASVPHRGHRGRVLGVLLLLLALAGYGAYWLSHANQTTAGPARLVVGTWVADRDPAPPPATAAPPRPTVAPAAAVAPPPPPAATWPLNDGGLPVPLPTALPPALVVAAAAAGITPQAPQTLVNGTPVAPAIPTVVIVAQHVVVVVAPSATPPPSPTPVLPTPHGNAQATGRSGPDVGAQHPAAWATWWATPNHDCVPDPDGYLAPTPYSWNYSLDPPPCGSHPPTATPRGAP